MLHHFKIPALVVTLTILLISGCSKSDDPTSTTPETKPPLIVEPNSTTITYTDYKSEQRTAMRDPGDAESLAKKGYQHTLFDSAEKKCQHCHNELYDTWKSSMHAKSWSDKIFQSKHQDFMRTHIAKIGEDKTAVGGILYTATMLQNGSSKTCIKCHAPAALYSGDFKVTVTALNDIDVSGDMNSTTLASLKAQYEVNTAASSTYDSKKATTVFGISRVEKKAYTLTYHIGNLANTEGIHCATCHSIETVRMMGNGADNDQYTLTKAMRVGPHGPIKKDASGTLAYSTDGTQKDMNFFFRLWGPEIYTDTHRTPKQANAFDDGSHPRIADGRYTFKSIDMNGTDGKVHYTGGPFYGPYGVTGLTNTNSNDESNRTAQVSSQFDITNNNHFGNFGKGLCLSCHQRSSGAFTGSEGKFMELCSTWIGVSNGTDTNANDSLTSPKCQKCHMPRLADKRVLHQWAAPEKLFTQSDTHLTEHFDPNSTTTTASNNPVLGGWMNDHAFVGGSKIGSANYLAKIKSGFAANLTVNGTTANIQLTNLTGHMFPGAHPMRRVLLRVVLTDENGNIVPMPSAITGVSTYATITNEVVSGDKTASIHTSGDSNVTVVDDGASAAIDFAGRTADLNGSPVTSQKFDGTSYQINVPDSTAISQSLQSGVIAGMVKNAAIVDDVNSHFFTRIYGHETGKMFDVDNNVSTPSVFIVRPGFDSNVVPNDNRFMPNEQEEYTIELGSLSSGSYTITYKLYYMQKGAGGAFPTQSTTGFLDVEQNIEKKLLISEVFSAQSTFTIF